MLNCRIYLLFRCNFNLCLYLGIEVRKKINFGCATDASRKTNEFSLKMTKMVNIKYDKFYCIPTLVKMICY